MSCGIHAWTIPQEMLKMYMLDMIITYLISQSQLPRAKELISHMNTFAYKRRFWKFLFVMVN